MPSRPKKEKCSAAFSLAFVAFASICSTVLSIKANTSFYIGDRYPVRVGVKSCADEVFFNQDWAQLPIPEDVFFREIVSQENISRWHTPKSLSRVVYPHIENNGKKGVLDIDKYPQAKAFFTIFETRLKKRKYLLESKTRKWYEYWVPQNPTLWAKPKIVFADSVKEDNRSSFEVACYKFNRKNPPT